MGTSKKEKQSENCESTEVKSKQFTITTILALIAIIMAVVAAGVGAYLGVYVQNDSKKQTTAKLIYDDIDRMNWTLSHLNKMINDNPNSIPVVFTPGYQDNSIYYSSRSDIALLEENVARNISIFYTDMEYAETYRKEILNAVGTIPTIPANITIPISYDQYKNAILEANAIRPQILDDFERIYHIQKSSSNRFNRF